MTKDQMQKATDYISSGGDLSAIEAKYEVSAAQRKVLRAIIKLK